MLDRAVYFAHLSRSIYARTPCILWEDAHIDQAQEWLTDIAQHSDLLIFEHTPEGVIRTLVPPEKWLVNQTISQAIQFATDRLYEHLRSVFVFILPNPDHIETRDWIAFERLIPLTGQRRGSLVFITPKHLPECIKKKGILLTQLPLSLQPADMKNNLSPANNPEAASIGHISWTDYPSTDPEWQTFDEEPKRKSHALMSLTNQVQRINIRSTRENSPNVDHLQQWLTQKRIHFKARDLQAPHGVLLLGSCLQAKARAAQLAAETWNVPLYRLDVASLQLSDYKQNCGVFKDLLRWIEDMSPCIFWIDHIDQAFESHSPERNKAHAQFVSELLAWQQKRKSKTLALLTAQDILKIPVELLHKGGFDKIFHLDVWTDQEREGVVRFLIGKHNLAQPSPAGLKQLVEATQELSSDDLKQIFRDLGLQTLIHGTPSNPDELYLKRMTEVKASRLRKNKA